ncbi:hypothetical protein EXE53_18350 [Halorubrum sp. SD626R]|uniref:DUF6663 family protein n=1 Tax=Halorubrum sp. SD626R TaxID=1419722 RepID=UPI0010F7469F|nr:DUF6663 family protein [Halorubrum sp. SD626R]TKX78977.1 hypothetical protein EXE53_18350 [Halorubrum sp. SD626R]
MDPTTSGRFRVHDRRPRPDIEGADDETGGEPDTDGADEEFVLVEHAAGPVDPTEPGADDRFDPLYATAEGYEGDLADRVASLEPGYVVDATLAWTDGSARFADVEVVRETRFRYADAVEGMFEAAVDAWRSLRADGEAVGSVTTRSNDGDPNGALYLFADGPGADTFDDLRAVRLPVEPLVARVNASRGDDDPREVFVLAPADHEFVAVYVVFDREGVLAQTVRDTYGLGAGLAAGLESGVPDAARAGEDDTVDADGDFDALDRL